MKINLRDLFPKTAEHDDRTVNALLSAVKSAFTTQFDYLNFKQAVQSMSEMNIDEITQYKSAFATASTMGVTKDNLVRSAETYMAVLKKEKESFANALKNQMEKKVEGKKDELNKIKGRILENERKIEELKRENVVLQEAIDNADEHVENAKVKIEQTKNSFLEAFDSINNDIKKDIESILKFLN